MPNSTDLFGLPEDATAEQVKRRWHELCLIHHPDHGGSAEDFQRLHAEYKRLMVEAETPKTCHRCNGIGTINVGSGFSYINMACPECDGTGMR